MDKQMLIIGGASLGVLLVVLVLVLIIKKEKYVDSSYIVGNNGYYYKTVGPFAGCTDSTDQTRQMIDLPYPSLRDIHGKDIYSEYDSRIYNNSNSQFKSISDYQSELTPRI